MTVSGRRTVRRVSHCQAQNGRIIRSILMLTVRRLKIERFHIRNIEV